MHLYMYIFIRTVRLLSSRDMYKYNIYIYIYIYIYMYIYIYI